ncbi:MAG: hypothetical protein RL481_444, partial [Pseudomonadota bacterium]
DIAGVASSILATPTIFLLGAVTNITNYHWAAHHTSFDARAKRR